MTTLRVEFHQFFRRTHADFGDTGPSISRDNRSVHEMSVVVSIGTHIPALSHYFVILIPFFRQSFHMFVQTEHALNIIYYMYFHTHRQ